MSLCDPRNMSSKGISIDRPELTRESTIHAKSEHDMTKRLTISVDDDAYEILEKCSDEEVRTVANLATAIVTLESRARQKQQEKS